MDNSYFILSKQKVEISRFQICTWDIENENSFVEFGIEFKFPDNTQEIEFKLVVPFIKDIESTPITCLLPNLISNTDNSKFIFNDNITEFKPIGTDKRNGGTLSLETRGNLSILPIENVSVEQQVISFKVMNSNLQYPSYIRFLVKTEEKTLSIEKKGIAKTSLIYDIKLNEKRNLPDGVYKIVKKQYSLCAVKRCFCFHVVPNSHDVSFIDQTKLKNIRELEVSAFKKYLPNELKTMKDGKYMIVFNKDDDKGENAVAYSFFTIFTKETIGSKQILLAIGANILCSLLFGISALRTSFDSEVSIWKQITIEYWVAIVVLITLIISLFSPLKRIKSLSKS